MKCTTAKAGSKGQGLFATDNITKGEPILAIQGPILTTADLPRVVTEDLDYYLQVGPDTFIGRSHGMDDYINHSCQPNAAIRIEPDRVFLYALEDLKPGDEITFDYSTTSTDTPDVWALHCTCGAPGCRGLISGWPTVPAARQAEYITAGVVPEYIKNYLE